MCVFHTGLHMTCIQVLVSHLEFVTCPSSGGDFLVQVEMDAKADLPLWLSETLHKHNLATVHRPNFLGEK